MVETNYNPSYFQDVEATELTELLLNENSANLTYIETPIASNSCALGIGIEKAIAVNGFNPPSNGEWVLVAAQLIT